MKTVAISDARANLTDLVSEVRMLRKVITLTQRGKARAAIIPVELADEIEKHGGPDAAATALLYLRERPGR